jgi:hypothetical protein
MDVSHRRHSRVAALRMHRDPAIPMKQFGFSIALCFAWE